MMTPWEYPVAGPEAYAADPCVPLDTTTPRFVTEDGVEFVRTPDSEFDGLADAGYPWEPNYVTVDGMRMHYIDAGPEDAEEVVLLLHGQPSWSFLYRRMVPTLVERGYRVICPDFLGMGRSDKPIELREHTYLKHVEQLKSFISQVVPDTLENPTVTLLGQDWGALIGFRVVGDEPDWFRRVVSANGELPLLPYQPYTPPEIVNYNCSDTRGFGAAVNDRIAQVPCGDLSGEGFSYWVEYSFRICFNYWIGWLLTTSKLQPSIVHNRAVANAFEASFYDFPFPSKIFEAAIRTFPSMIAAVHEPEFGNFDAWETLKQFPRPFLVLAGADDPGLGSVEAQSFLYNNIAGAKIHSFEHKRYQGVGHFLQEEAGPEVATDVADFIDGTACIQTPGGMMAIVRNGCDQGPTIGQPNNTNPPAQTNGQGNEPPQSAASTATPMLFLSFFLLVLIQLRKVL